MRQLLFAYIKVKDSAINSAPLIGIPEKPKLRLTISGSPKSRKAFWGKENLTKQLRNGDCRVL